MRLKSILFLVLLTLTASVYTQTASDVYKEGKILRTEGKKGKSIKKFEKALTQAEDENNIQLQMSCHIQLAELKDNVINYKEALEHYKAFTKLYKNQTALETNALQDSVSGLHSDIQESSEVIEENKIAIQEQNKTLDSLSTEQMQSQLDIANLELEKEKHLLEMQEAQNRRNLLLFITVIVVIAALFVFLGYARKRRMNNTLRNKNYQEQQYNYYFNCFSHSINTARLKSNVLLYELFIGNK